MLVWGKGLVGVEALGGGVESPCVGRMCVLYVCLVGVVCVRWVVGTVRAAGGVVVLVGSVAVGVVVGARCCRSGVIKDVLLMWRRVGV